MNNQNSRRSFISSLAILSAGTAIAGSPINLFSATEKTTDLQQVWKSYLKIAGAKEYTGSAVLDSIEITNTKGHFPRFGNPVYLQPENVLARPVWIYWANNQLKPADVLINIYENEAPYKKIKTVNRYELAAMLQVFDKTGDAQLILASPNKKDEPENSACRLHVKTLIHKKFQIQHVSYFKNRQLLLNEKFIYNT